MLTCLCLAVLACPSPQSLPLVQGPQQRFLDYSKDLERPTVSVVIGTLGRFQEGRRERLEDGALGGPGARSSVSGTQFFKVPVRTSLQVQEVLAGGKPARTNLEFELQLARLPDGSERRQVIGGNGAPLETGVQALWVVELPEKGKALQLLHVLPRDPRIDDDPRAFADLCRDFTAINRHVADLRAALAALEAAPKGEPGSLPRALEGLRQVLAARPTLKEPKHDAVLQQHAGPLEARAKQALAERDGGKGPG